MYKAYPVNQKKKEKKKRQHPKERKERRKKNEEDQCGQAHVQLHRGIFVQK